MRKKGKLYVQDGKHRLEAAQTLGIRGVPVIFKSNSLTSKKSNKSTKVNQSVYGKALQSRLPREMQELIDAVEAEIAEARALRRKQ